MKRISFTEEELHTLWKDAEEADRPAADLPMAYMAERTEAASKVDVFLRSQKAPVSVMEAFERLCEELMIPYLASIQAAADAMGKSIDDLLTYYEQTDPEYGSKLRALVQGDIKVQKCHDAESGKTPN